MAVIDCIKWHRLNWEQRLYAFCCKKKIANTKQTLEISMLWEKNLSLLEVFNTETARMLTSGTTDKTYTIFSENISSIGIIPLPSNVLHRRDGREEGHLTCKTSHPPAMSNDSSLRAFCGDMAWRETICGTGRENKIKHCCSTGVYYYTWHILVNQRRITLLLLVKC